MGHDKPTFYLYGQGEPEDVICLGNLVLKDPRNPRVPGYFWTAEALSDDDRQNLTYSIPIDGEFSMKHGLNLGIAVEAADLVHLDLSWTRTRDRLVTAKAGRRILLKNPQAFLNEKILPHTSAQEQLRLWLTTGNIFRHLLAPKVWMCTGLYVFTDASMHEVRSTQATFNPEISSITMAALCSVPLGGSISIGPNKELTTKVTAAGDLVWAAQYRLLDLKYLDKPAPGSTASLPHIIRLLPNIVSNATLRGEDIEFVQVSLSETAGTEPDSTEVEAGTGTDVDDGDEVTWSQFDQNLQALREYFDD